MNLNPVSSNIESVGAYEAPAVNSPATTPAADAASSAPAADPKSEGVVYEHTNAPAADSTKQIYTKNTALVEQMKADADARAQQLKDLVMKMMGEQGNALAQADDIWSFLASGNYTVTEAAKVKAQEDIAEGGYYDVENTSDRILEFAKGLSGGDPAMIDKLKDAFEKGFNEATKTWGKELPEISQKTYKATMDKFDKWKEEANAPAAPAESEA